MEPLLSPAGWAPPPGEGGSAEMSQLPNPRPTPTLLKNTLRRKSRKSFGSTNGSPEPPRPPVKSSSPKSRVYGKTRSPGPERVGGESALITSPSYDASNRTPYFEQCFEVLDELGQGSYAKVYKARCRDDGEFYAVKKALRNYSGPADRNRKLKEVANLKVLGNHVHCVRYYDAWEESDQLYIQMELCPGVSLKNYVEGDGNICPDEWTLWSFLSDIARGLSHVHAQGYVHMDIKPANIFIHDNTTLKIGDFGIATPYSNSYGGSVVTAEERDDGDPVYMAPELLDSASSAYFGPAVDVFSAGITMLDVASEMELPGSGDTWRALRTLDGRPADERGSLPRELLGPAISDEFADLIESMLAADPYMRPTMDSILQHPKIAESDGRRARRRMLLAPVRAIKNMFAWMLRMTMLLLGKFVPRGVPVPKIMIDGARRVASHEPLLPGEPLEPVRIRLKFDDNAPIESPGAASERLQRRLGDLDFQMAQLDD